MTPQWLPTAESGNQPEIISSALPPHGGNRTVNSNTSKTMPIESPTNNPLNRKSAQTRSPIWQERATRIDPSLKRKTYGVAVRGKSRVAYHGNRPAGNHPRPRLAHPDPARELADLLARGASIGRIAPGHYFRGGQLLVGFLRTLRAVVRILEIEQRPQQQRAGTNDTLGMSKAS